MCAHIVSFPDSAYREREREKGREGEREGERGDMGTRGERDSERRGRAR